MLVRELGHVVAVTAARQRGGTGGAIAPWLPQVVRQFGGCGESLAPQLGGRDEEALVGLLAKVGQGDTFGGIRGGSVYGASDAQAAYVKDRPVTPEDFLATLHHALGLPDDAEVRDRADRPYRITDGKRFRLDYNIAF